MLSRLVSASSLGRSLGAAAFFAVLVGSAGCVFMTPEESFRRTTLAQASFAMDCPAQNVDVLIVQRRALVKGCGHKASYIWLQGAGWVMESGPGR
jgi:hypothetical protein